MITISSSMRLRPYIEQYKDNAEYYLPDMNGEGKNKDILMNKHKEKIMKSDTVLVLHDGQIGESVQEEILFAVLHGKTITSKDVRQDKN